MALVSQAITILAGKSMSASLKITGTSQQIIAVVLPPAWDPAPITFQWSIDGTNWYDVFDRQGHEQNFTWTASALVPIQSPYGFYAYPYLQIRSGGRAQPVMQSVSRSFTVLSQ
jgi:hypothetical protein